MNKWRNRDEYIIKDELGRWINTEFPPVNFKKYPNYSGYKTPNQEYLFYQFAVLYYDVIIEYKGVKMLLVADLGGCNVADLNWDGISQIYATANDLIREFRLKDGKTLCEVVDDKTFSINIY